MNNENNSMLAMCPYCENKSSLERVREIENITVRGESIAVNVEYFKCHECGEEFDISRPDYTPVKDAYDEYRRLKGMVQPKDIISFRKKFGLTQKEFSKLLGLGVATLNRYENGALQNKAHDRLLKFSFNLYNFRKMLEDDPDIFDRERIGIILDLINKSEVTLHNWLDITLDEYGNYKPDILSGYLKFNVSKYFQAIKFFCFEEREYKSKLLKLLFYSDFKHFKEYTTSITGARYAHLSYGPGPDKYDIWFTALLNTEPAMVKEEVWCNHETPGEIFYSQEHPDLSDFTTSEVKILAGVKEFFEDYTAKQISDFSHEEKGYLETASGRIISFEYADALQI